MKETIKIIILEIDHWSGCNHFHRTMYFKNGKRITQNAYYQWLSFSDKYYRFVNSRFETKHEGLNTKHYTYCFYEGK